MGQYIGARYVPKFMGVYDPTQMYEALDVVDNGLGTSYITKIPTPAGTPLTNTTYWAIYGASSGAIVNLQNQIDDMQDGTVPGSLQEQINTNTSDITALTNHDKERFSLKNRKFIFISDSYGAMTDMIANAVNYMGLTADNYVIDCVSGFSFVGYGDDTGRFVDLLSRALTNFDDPTEVTDIVVVGGLNDSTNAYSNEQALYNAMAYFKQYAIANAPNAQIHVGYIGYCDYNSADLAGRDYIKQYITIARYIGNCGMLGFHYMTNIEFTLHGVPGSLGADGVHPSTLGAEMLAKMIVNGILTGTCDVTYMYPAYNYVLAFTLPSNVSAATQIALGNFAKHNEQINFSLGEIEFTLDYSAAINFSTLAVELPITNYPFVLMQIATGKTIPCTYQISYNDNGTKFMICPGTVTFSEKKIIFKPFPFVNGSNNWVTAIPLSLKLIGGANVTIPTMQC